MRIAIVLCLLISGCVLDDDGKAQNVEAWDASPQEPATARPQRSKDDRLQRDAGYAGWSDRDAAIYPEMDPPNPALAADSGARSVGVATLDAGTRLPARTTDGSFASSAPADLPAEGRCVSGTYQGPVVSLLSPGMRPSESSGTITLKLSAISGQDQLWVTGEFKSVLQTGAGLVPDEAPLVIKVRAVLDCPTHQLQDGLLIGADGETEMVIGMLQGTYSDKPASLSGTWLAGGLIFGSSGSWSASAQTNAERVP